MSTNTSNQNWVSCVIGTRRVIHLMERNAAGSNREKKLCLVVLFLFSFFKFDCINYKDCMNSMLNNSKFNYLKSLKSSLSL